MPLNTHQKTVFAMLLGIKTYKPVYECYMKTPLLKPSEYMQRVKYANKAIRLNKHQFADMFRSEICTKATSECVFWMLSFR